jgi:TolB-like protein
VKEVVEEPVEPMAVVEEKPVVEEIKTEPVKEVVEEPTEPMVVVDENPVVEEIKTEPVKEVVEEPTQEPVAMIEKGRENIVVLPFDNLTNENNAVNKIMPGLKQRLKDRGLHVIDDELLSDFLCDRRIRSASYISKKIAQEVGKELKAKTILAGSVVSFSSEGLPKVGILSRLIDSSTGVILWADYVSVSGDDYSVVFGLGTINKVEELVPKVLDKLFASFSMGISPMNTESVYRVAVMPFKNNSDSPNAGTIATHMFMVELLKNPAFEPVEYGEIRKLCVELKIRNKGELEFKNIKAISEALGTYMILLGSVDDYVYGTKSSAVPNVGISVRLLDARENRILWYNRLQLSGEEDIIAFDWGNVRQVDKLAYKAVSELVRELGKVKWH